MKTNIKIVIFFIFFLIIQLEAKERTTYKVELQNLEFSNSTQKENGIRYSAKITHKQDKHKFMFLFENTQTQTFQPPLPHDLNVKKYSFKYNYQLKNDLTLQASYISISDNLVATDGGNIYGIGATHKNIHFAQFFSDYDKFDLYQSDLSASFKNNFGLLKTKTTLIGKYIILKDYKDNPLSKNAKNSYLTPGIKLHASYKNYFGGAGAFFGKRIFSVMDDGLKVQHHGMEFNETYTIGIGKKFKKFKIMLKYGYSKATEIPKWTENVKVNSLALMIEIKN